ncbi:hypothetical protein [Nocardia macrotermitis]|uniref:hypothetical protein n=1 Tax=Nocardia macrotermitis TaxID=2585198 RepID=UPI00129556AF|nr:hypothetical protein [Nocardia macrotermitis]
MSIRRFAISSVLTGAALATFAAGPALAQIPLQPAPSTPDVQNSQPIADLSATGSVSTGSFDLFNLIFPHCGVKCS